MDSGRSKLYMQRAKNELDLAKAIFKLSTSSRLKADFGLKEDSTFFSNVIGSSYYCIFYSAKALLQSRNIRTTPPEEHKKTLMEFEKLVLSGKIDSELLKIYKSAAVKADTLLGVFASEKDKRGEFTYQTLPDANKEPASDSMRNATSFLSTVKKLI